MSAHRLPPLPMILKSLCIWMLVLCILFPAPAICGIFGDFSVEDEKELGKKYDTFIRSRMPIVEDPEVVDYVKGIVDRIATQLPKIPFTLKTTVIRNRAINAFATPGGYVYVFTGLITNFDHEAEMAGVVAHELGHVTQRHIAKRIEQMQKVQLGMLAGVLAGVLLGTGGSDSQGELGEALMVGAIAGGQSAMLSYSRVDEREADHVGMTYLTGAGYSPYGLPGAFEKIRRKHYLAGSSIPAYLSTHPAAGERIGYLEDRIAQMPESVRNTPQDDASFLRIKTLVRARYDDPEAALGAFSSEDDLFPAYKAMGKGIVYARKKMNAEAKASFEKALELAPNDSLVLREIGRFHYKQGDAKLAGKTLTKAALLNPRDLIALFFLARLQAEQGKVQQAVGYYERILNKLPEDAEVHYHLGLTLGQSGDAFGGHTHMAYWGIYSLNKKKAQFHLDKAKTKIKTPEQQKAFDELKAVYDGRSEFW